MRAQVGDDLDGKQQPRDPPDRPGKMLHVADESLLLEPVKVVVDKGAERDTQGHDGRAGRRHDAGDEAEQVVEDHEQEDAGDEGLKSLVAVADDLLAVAAGELMDHLGDLLRGIGILDRQGEPNQEEEEDQASGDRQLQGVGVVDGKLGVGGMDADRVQQREHERAEEVIEEARNGETVSHEDE